MLKEKDLMLRIVEVQKLANENNFVIKAIYTPELDKDELSKRLMGVDLYPLEDQDKR